MSQRIVNAIKKSGRCDICGKKYKIGYVTDDNKIVCFACAEKIDWVHARILRKRVRPKKYVKNHFTYDSLMDYVKENHLDGDAKIIEILNEGMTNKVTPSSIYRKIRWQVLNTASYDKIKAMYGDCLLKYRIVRDILRKRHGEMSKKLNDISFKNRWDILASKLKCDDDWIDEYLKARLDTILELGEGKEINYLMNLSSALSNLEGSNNE